MRFFSYGSRMVNWAHDFEECPVIEDIPERVRNLEKSFYFWALYCAVLLIVGLVLLASASSSRLQLLGLFIGLMAFTTLALHATCVNIALASYRTIWDSQNRMQQELDKMASSDL